MDVQYANLEVGVGGRLTPGCRSLYATEIIDAVLMAERDGAKHSSDGSAAAAADSSPDGQKSKESSERKGEEASSGRSNDDVEANDVDGGGSNDGGKPGHEDVASSAEKGKGEDGDRDKVEKTPGDDAQANDHGGGDADKDGDVAGSAPDKNKETSDGEHQDPKPVDEAATKGSGGGDSEGVDTKEGEGGTKRESGVGADASIKSSDATGEKNAEAADAAAEGAADEKKGTDKNGDSANGEHSEENIGQNAKKSIDGEEKDADNCGGLQYFFGVCTHGRRPRCTVGVHVRRRSSWRCCSPTESSKRTKNTTGCLFRVLCSAYTYVCSLR